MIIVVLKYFLFFFLGWGVTVSTCYVGHELTYCTIPGWYMNMVRLVAWELAGETEVLGENLPPRWKILKFK
jgi:hypothetical protein